MYGQMKPIFGAGIVRAVGYLAVCYWAFAQVPVVPGTTAPHDALGHCTRRGTA
jgi:hypothetical protein